MQKVNFDPVGERRIAEKFVADKVDLILVFPSEASLTVKAVTRGTDVPMVFANANIEGVDLVESLRRPGGNITGVRFPGPDIAIKRLEVMIELVPDAKRIWIPFQRGYPIVPRQMEALYPVAASLGVTLEEAPFSGVSELKAALAAREKSDDIGMDAILLIPEPLTVTQEAFEVYGRFMAKHRLPVGGSTMVGENYATLFGLSTNKYALGRQAAPLADKILKGTPAGIIPVVSAENYLQINIGMARKLGLTVPESLLKLADEIIQ
jgi:putative ABC transport system substrate-binding protein